MNDAEKVTINVDLCAVCASVKKRGTPARNSQKAGKACVCGRETEMQDTRAKFMKVGVTVAS